MLEAELLGPDGDQGARQRLLRPSRLPPPTHPPGSTSISSPCPRGSLAPTQEAACPHGRLRAPGRREPPPGTGRGESRRRGRAPPPQEAGRTDLAGGVEHVSRARGDGPGFDVLSFDPEGTERYLEVKTTRQGLHWPMLVTRNEAAFSQEAASRFHLYRVFDFGRPALAWTASPAASPRAACSSRRPFRHCPGTPLASESALARRVD